MSVSRCNKCGVVTEHANELAGTTAICDSCGASGKIYDTVLFINHILKLFAEQQRELNQFKEAVSKVAATADAPVAKSHADEFIDFDIYNTAPSPSGLACREYQSASTRVQSIRQASLTKQLLRLEINSAFWAKWWNASAMRNRRDMKAR